MAATSENKLESIDHMSQLPDCILLRILKLLQYSNVQIWQVRIVCKRWYALLADSEFWRVCNLSNFKLNDTAVLDKMVKYLPVNDLEYVEINRNELATDALEMFIRRATTLRALRLNSCTIINKKERRVKTYKTSKQLDFLDVRMCRGSMKFMEQCLLSSGSTIKTLGVTSSFGPQTLIKNKSFLTYLPNLTMLECYDCIWMNDTAMLDISIYCKQLSSLNVKKCLHVKGKAIQELLTNCKKLQTLLLRRTSIQNKEIIRTDWNNCNLTELDLSHCYFLEDEAIEEAIDCLATKLTYLRCGLTDVLVSRLIEYNKLNVKTLEISRRHPLNIENIGLMLSKCEYLVSLDVSLTPMDYSLIKDFLPKLCNLEWFSIAGHGALKTAETLILIGKSCPKIVEIGVNFYKVKIESDLKDALLEAFYTLLEHGTLRKLCMTGSYIHETLRKMQEESKKYDEPTIKVRYQDNFKLMHPTFCLNAPTKYFPRANIHKPMPYY